MLENTTYFPDYKQSFPVNDLCGFTPLLTAVFYGQSQASNSDCNTDPRADNKVKIISGDIVRRNHHGEQNLPKPQTIMDISHTILV